MNKNNSFRTRGTTKNKVQSSGLLNIVLKVQTTVIRQEIKVIQIQKKEVKLLLFADDMAVYIENPIDSIKNLFVLVTEFSKVVGYKVNIQKSIAFLYTSNEISERDTKKKILFTIAMTTKTEIKYLGINITKVVEDLYSENYGTLTKRN